MAASEEVDVEGLQANYREVLQKVKSAQEEVGAQHVSADLCPPSSFSSTKCGSAGKAGCS